MKLTILILMAMLIAVVAAGFGNGGTGGTGFGSGSGTGTAANQRFLRRLRNRQLRNSFRNGNGFANGRFGNRRFFEN